MTHEEIDEFILKWPEFDKKVYTYKRDFMPDEYLVIKRTSDGLLELDQKNSTHIIQYFNKEMFGTMIREGNLIYKQEQRWDTNLIDLKTGGCTCGSWALPNHTNLHTGSCPLVNKRY